MTVLYFALAFAVTWALDLPALLAHEGLIDGPPERYMALVGLGAFGPMVAAMIAARVEGTGLKALFRPIGTWRVGVSWYFAALLLPGSIFVLRPTDATTNFGTVASVRGGSGSSGPRPWGTLEVSDGGALSAGALGKGAAGLGVGAGGGGGGAGNGGRESVSSGCANALCETTSSDAQQANGTMGRRTA